MSRTLSITDDEVSLMDQLLHAELTSSYSEIRRTRNPSYRAQVKRRRELTEHLLESIAAAHPSETAPMIPAGT